MNTVVVGEKVSALNGVFAERSEFEADIFSDGDGE